jgi:hypothetical protein
LWYRGLAMGDEAAFAPEVDMVLEKLSARMMVVGHSPSADGRVTMRFGGRIVQLDTGMLNGSFYPGGRASALEIRDGKLSAIYEDRREELGSITTALRSVPLPSALPAANR